MDANTRYIEGRKLGSGSYGDVYKAFDSVHDRLVAMKHIKVTRRGIGLPSTTLREITVLQELRHPNIVRLEDVAIDFPRRGAIALVFEYLDTDLSKHIRYERSMCRSGVKLYMHQLLSGLAHCNERCVMHRDIKPANILLDRSTNTLKLADFGLARHRGIPISAFTHEVVTLWYRSPEILLGAPEYDSSVDVWSLGCVFAELAIGRPLFPGNNEIDQIFKIFKVLGTPSPASEVGQLKHFNAQFPNFPRTDLATITRLPPLGVDLLARMLEYTPSRRISASNALRHPYFADVSSDAPPHRGTSSPPAKRVRKE
jgi:cyclin-dependent kinase 2